MATSIVKEWMLLFAFLGWCVTGHFIWELYVICTYSTYEMNLCIVYPYTHRIYVTTLGEEDV